MDSTQAGQAQRPADLLIAQVISEQPSPPDDGAELHAWVMAFGHAVMVRTILATMPTPTANDAAELMQHAFLLDPTKKQEHTLAAFDAAVAAELPRVSHVEYDSHEICKHFAAEVRKRLAAPVEGN